MDPYLRNKAVDNAEAALRNAADRDRAAAIARARDAVVEAARDADCECKACLPLCRALADLAKAEGR